MGAVNLDVYRGDTLPISLECKDAAGAAFDLTGYTVAVKVSWDERKRIGDDETDHEYTLTESSLTINRTVGTIAGELTSAQTKQLPLDRRTKLFLILTDAGGDIKTIRIGRIKVDEP